ncbi:acetylglutamate kinase [Filifactor villosus]|uniref:Acetylglutamate kinase n=1 Tax=Filifactor villosus TaxID=29374 RepID=A0ABV9QN12_9FIRM
MNNEQAVQNLVSSMPYLRNGKGKVVVIKFGGNAMINDEIKQSVIEDIVLMQLAGIKPVISHGGGPAINEMLKKLNIQSEFVNGLRVTSKDVIEVVEMVLAGKVNGELVQNVTKTGGTAVGVSGVSAGIYHCKKTEGEYDYGFVGEVVSVDPTAIEALLEKNIIPIVSPIGSDGKGNTYNINGDTAAGELAAALNADKLYLLTDIEGLCNSIELRDVISYLNTKDVPLLKEKGVIAGGMIPKIDCCVRAIENGVKTVQIIDGRKPHSILYEEFFKEGNGTTIGVDQESVGIK